MILGEIRRRALLEFTQTLPDPQKELTRNFYHSVRNYKSMHEHYASSLKRQRDRLNELIAALNQKEHFTESSLHFYDITTQQIERVLRTLRHLIAAEASQKFEAKRSPKLGINGIK